MSRVRCIKHLSCWALLVLVAGLPVRAQPVAKLTLQVVPSGYSNATSPKLSLRCSHFLVLLTNTSAAPVAVFEEWNSWGYYGLSFAFTYPDGRTVRVAKKPGMWDKNFPSTMTLAPGGVYSFVVNFDPEVWWNSPLEEKRTPLRERPANGARCRMRAIYTIDPSESRAKGLWIPKGISLWTGSVTSAEKAYILSP